MSGRRTEWLDEWLLAIVGGTIVALVIALVTPHLPWLPSRQSAPSGTLVVTVGNGVTDLIEISGDHAPAEVNLAPRLRTESARGAFDPHVDRISVTSATWNPRSNRFLGTSGIGTLSGVAHPLADTGVATYLGSGVQASLLYVTNESIFSDLSVAPSTSTIAVTVEPVTAQTAKEHIDLIQPGGQITKLPPGSGGRSSWSADGQSVFYPCSPHGGSPQLCRYRVRSKQQTIIPLPGFEAISDPDVAPDGHDVAFAARAGTNNYSTIGIVNIATGRVVTATRDSAEKSYPTFDRSGHYLAYLSTTGVQLIDLETNRTSTIVTVQASALQWTPSPLAAFGLT